jgi:hypothetical protein
MDVIKAQSPDLSVTYGYIVDYEDGSNNVSHSGLDIRFKDRHRFAILTFGDVGNFLFFVYGKPQDIINYINRRNMARYVYSQKFIRIMGFKYIYKVMNYLERSQDVVPNETRLSHVNLFRIPEQSTDFSNFEFVASDGQSYYIH